MNEIDLNDILQSIIGLQVDHMKVQENLVACVKALKERVEALENERKQEVIKA